MSATSLEWAATLTGISAAIVVSLNAGARITGWGFVVFLVSSTVWSIVAWLEEENGLLLQNLVLSAINLFGIYRYLWRKTPEDGSGAPDREGRKRSGHEVPSG